jgi:hypothetical protein
MLQRMRELAIQASNDTNNNEQRSYLDLEFQQLKKQIVQIANNTEWNGFPVLNGSTGERVGIRPVYKTTSEPAAATAVRVTAGTPTSTSASIGDLGVTESNEATFNAMNPGETIIMGGLKYTTDVSNSAGEVADAFANITLPESPTVNGTDVTFKALKAGEVFMGNRFVPALRWAEPDGQCGAPFRCSAAGLEQFAVLDEIAPHRVQAAKTLAYAVDHGFLGALFGEGAEEAIPHHQDAAVVAVDAIVVLAMVYAMVGGSNEYPVQPAEATHLLGMHPHLVEQVDEGHGGEHHRGHTNHR